MCNINLIWKKDNRISKGVSECMNLMSVTSFHENQDGEGYLSVGENGWIYNKHTTKFIFRQPYAFIATHQRFATSGKNADNNQPIASENLIVMHNGIIHGIGDEKKSDTAIFVELLEKEYKKKRSVPLALKTALKENYGSWSLLIFDRNTLKVFYAKNNSTQMFMCDHPHYLILSTKKFNVEMACRYLSLKFHHIRPVKNYWVFDLFESMHKGVLQLSPMRDTWTDKSYTMPSTSKQWRWDKGRQRGGYTSFDSREKLWNNWDVLAQSEREEWKNPEWRETEWD